MNGSVVASVVGAAREKMSTFLVPRRPALLPAPIRGVFKVREVKVLSVIELRRDKCEGGKLER